MRVVWAVLKRLVAAPILAAFGGRLRVAVSGGAPLDERVGRLLIGLGLPLIEGYGLTEAAPTVAGNALDENVPGSVGRPLLGIEVMLSAEGELLVRSPATMMGYWKDETETKRALDSAGWLSTGDIAEIHDGRVFIRGRLKEMIVLSIGEKINPTVVEAAITQDALFRQAAVFGDGRRFLASLIVLNLPLWKRFAQENDLDPDRPNEQPGRTRILARLVPLLAALPNFAQVRAVHLTFEPWTIEAGLLTPTFKIKRDVLQRAFAQEIDALYAGEWEVGWLGFPRDGLAE
jgi:long-chain acyl-CoA synthetase